VPGDFEEKGEDAGGPFNNFEHHGGREASVGYPASGRGCAPAFLGPVIWMMPSAKGKGKGKGEMNIKRQPKPAQAGLLDPPHLTQVAKFFEKAPHSLDRSFG
jgi:hypothetical protein